MSKNLTNPHAPVPASDLLIYQAPDGTIKIDVRLEHETVWLTQEDMAQLFGKAKSTINEHIKNIFAEGELQESDVTKKFGISEFQQKAPNFYNLDVIISVGYRVRSQQGVRFRIWATQRQASITPQSHSTPQSPEPTLPGWPGRSSFRSVQRTGCGSG